MYSATLSYTTSLTLLIGPGKKVRVGTPDYRSPIELYRLGIAPCLKGADLNGLKAEIIFTAEKETRIHTIHIVPFAIPPSTTLFSFILLMHQSNVDGYGCTPKKGSR